ncbi:MAG: HAD family hydrolase [Anaerolineae bacterium]
MLRVSIPGFGELAFSRLLLDINGTLTMAGGLIPGVASRVASLREELEVLLVTADTRGTAGELAETLGVAVERVPAGGEAEAKAGLVKRLGADHVAAIGNGANDALMLEVARLGIAVLGVEGLAVSALTKSDIVVSSIRDALDLLTDPVRVVSTLRR